MPQPSRSSLWWRAALQGLLFVALWSAVAAVLDRPGPWWTALAGGLAFAVLAYVSERRRSSGTRAR